MSEDQWIDPGLPEREGSKKPTEIDEWAGVVRTPSTEKPRKKDTIKRAPSKAPPVDDQSIGKAWETDDD